MRTSTGKPTADESAHIERAKASGCVCCWFNEKIGDFKPTGEFPEYHHRVEGNRRLGHLRGFALCHWHHQGKRFPLGTKASSARDVAKIYGPSMERHPEQFEATYGTQDELEQYGKRLMKTNIAEACAA